ncbi:hypothetical protein F2Q68_00025434 [Brassica cretica]|uniref:Uncharacterized protein n=1 Tax=Brassica cretica TaxID=69181 RepID=A0A8S9IA61_BRACR|nr:hypothetical protein F2Q68_00025434 [Brassica cretica]
MNTNRLCLTLIDPDVHYDPVRVVRQQIDTHTVSSIDSNESPMTDERYPTSLDGKQPVDHLALPDQCYPDFAFKQPNNRGRDDYSIGSWADSGFHESFGVDTVNPSSNEDPTEEYDEDYRKERAIEIAMQDDRYSGHSFNNTSPPSIDRVHSASVDTHPHPAKRSYASIDTIPGPSIDIKAAAFEKEKGNIPIPSRDPDGHARAMDGRILKVSREDISDILQVANGPDNLFMQQHNILDNIPTVPDEHPGANIIAIGSHQSYLPVGHASVDKVAPTSFDRVTPMSLDKRPSPSIDRRYEFGHRAYDIYGARKFRWEQKKEYGVYRDEFGYARSVAGEMIPVTKENIRKILERASLYEESHICLPEHSTSFTPTRLAPEIYTKDEINEMVTGIWGAQERLGDELKTLVDDTYQPLDRGYNELFRSMADMRTEIESMQHSLEKEATTSPSIDAYKATSIDVKPQTSQIPAEPQSDYGGLCCRSPLGCFLPGFRLGIALFQVVDLRILGPFSSCPSCSRRRRCIGCVLSGVGSVQCAMPEAGLASRRFAPAVWSVRKVSPSDFELLKRGVLENNGKIGLKRLLLDRTSKITRLNSSIFGNMEGSPYRKFSISWKGARFQGPNSGFLLVGTWSVPLSGTRGSGSCLEAGGNDTGIFFPNRRYHLDRIHKRIWNLRGVFARRNWLNRLSNRGWISLSRLFRFFGLNFCEGCSVDWPLHWFVSLLMAEIRRSPSLVLAEEVSACLDVCSEIAGRSCT